MNKIKTDKYNIVMVNGFLICENKENGGKVVLKNPDEHLDWLYLMGIRKKMNKMDVE